MSLLLCHNADMNLTKSEFAKENNENYLTDEEQHKIIIKDYDTLSEYREQQKTEEKS